MKTRFCAFLLCLMLALSACKSAPIKGKAVLKDAAAVNKGHMNDKSLPKEARLIGQDNYDLDNQLLFIIYGVPVPADTKERMDARKKDGDK